MSVPLGVKKGYELTFEEKMILGSLTGYPGFHILVKLMEEKCEEATRKVIGLRADTPDYVKVLQRCQLEARAMHDFSRSILDSIQWQKETALIEQDEQDSPAEKILRQKDNKESVLQSNS